MLLPWTDLPVIQIIHYLLKYPFLPPLKLSVWWDGFPFRGEITLWIWNFLQVLLRKVLYFLPVTIPAIQVAAIRCFHIHKAFPHISGHSLVAQETRILTCFRYISGMPALTYHILHLYFNGHNCFLLLT